MSGMEPLAGGKTKRGLGKGLTLAIAAAVLVGVAAALYVIAGSSFKPGAAFGVDATGAMKKLVAVTPAPPPTVGFVDAAGKPVHIADFKGQVVLVNLWATWCGPCVKEMPTLAALQRSYAGKPVKVVAVSIDSAETADKAKAFIAGHAPLDFYQNADLKLPFAFQPPAQEFPTTVIYGKDGLQRARMTGDADWSSPDAHKVIDKLLAAPS